MELVIRYSAFAITAILINLAGQELSLLVYQGAFSLYASIATGTACGLIGKYLLDKIYIFRHQTDSLRDEMNKFVTYSANGVFTTAIFWSFELGFEFLFGTKLMRYCGAVIGLSLGYLIKYRLDKRYVFRSWTR